MADLQLVDPSTVPFLSGRYAPIQDEIDASDLAVEGANAFEDGGVIHLDFPMTPAPSLLANEAACAGRSGYSRATIDPDAGTLTMHVTDVTGIEFPRIDDRLVGRRHRYALVGGHAAASRVEPYEHDGVIRVDMEAGTSCGWDTNAAMGEVAFAPRTGSTGELDGYYVAFGTDIGDGRSALSIWDAAEFPSAPVAKVLLPHRVPNGLHGGWIPA